MECEVEGVNVIDKRSQNQHWRCEVAEGECAGTPYDTKDPDEALEMYAREYGAGSFPELMNRFGKDASDYNVHLIG